MTVNRQVVCDPNGVFASLAAGKSTIDAFTYAMTEPGDKSFTGTITVTVTGLNIIGTAQQRTR
jgi:hypothetical protein